MASGPGITVPVPRRSRLLAPAPLALALVLALWMLLVLYPHALARLGIQPYNRWFLDSYAVLAASDAVRQGMDPVIANPLDALQRDHKYSDWWYALGSLGLTRQHNWMVGLSWVGAMLGAVWATVRPGRWRGAGWLVVVLVSPPFLLVFNRANNDLVIFALLALAGLALARPGWLRIAAAAVAVAVATGLKFYPLVAVVGFLGVRPRRRMLLAVGLAALTGMAAFLDVAGALPRGQFEMPATVHTFGAAILCRDLHWPVTWAVPAGALLTLLAGTWLAVRGKTTGLGEGEAGPAVLEVIGLTVMLACFFAGISYGYRWIFALWPGYWLRQRSGDATAAPRDRRWARVAGILLLLGLWQDGLLCLAVNFFVLGLRPEQLVSLQHVWRLATQPLVWALMILFSGYLIEWLRRQARVLTESAPGSGAP